MREPSRWPLAIILISYAVLAVAYNVRQPLWEAPDEVDHFEFARYVQAHKALPQGDPSWPAQIDAWNPVSEYNQAPLYYVVLAVVLAPLHLAPDAAFHPNTYVSWPGHPWAQAVALHRTDEGWPYHGLALAVHLGRLLSLAFAVVTLLATYALVATFARGRLTPLFATAWLAWTPSFLLASSRVDNDAAAATWSVLTLLLSARLLIARCPSGGLALAGLAAALSGALLSKLNDAWLIPIVAAAAFVATAPGQPLRAWMARRAGTAALTLIVPLGLLLAWWLVYGQTFQGRVGTSAGLGILRVGELVGGGGLARMPGALWGWNGTWWGGVGFGNLLLWPPVVYTALAAPLVVLVGAGLSTLRDRSWWAKAGSRRWALTVLVVATIPLVYATLARQALPSVNLDANARLTLPAAPLVALLVGLGGEYLPLGRWRRLLAVGYAGAILGLAVATAALLLPRIPAVAIPARLATDPSEAARPALARFANGVELLGADGFPSSLPRGGQLPLTLHWRVAVPPPEDFVAFVQLVDRQGERVAGNDVIPVERVLPPRLWLGGEIVDDERTIAIPASLPPGVYAVRIGMYQLRENVVVPIGATSAGQPVDAVAIGSWRVLPDVATDPPDHAVNAAFGDDVALRGYSLRTEGPVRRVFLYWEARRPIARRLVVSVQLLDAQGRLVAQHDGEPADGRLPTTDWAPGDLIRDEHAVSAPPGTDLRTIVVLYDRETLQRRPVSSPGRPPADDLALDP